MCLTEPLQTRGGITQSTFSESPDSLSAASATRRPGATPADLADGNDSSGSRQGAMKMGCFEVKAALYEQVCGNCDSGNAASQARIESRKRALMNDPGLRKNFETSVGVTTTNLNIRRPKPTWVPCAASLIGSRCHHLQQIVHPSPVCAVYFLSNDIVTNGSPMFRTTQRNRRSKVSF